MHRMESSGQSVPLDPIVPDPPAFIYTMYLRYFELHVAAGFAPILPTGARPIASATANNQKAVTPVFDF